MVQDSDFLLSKISVRLKDTASKSTIGSGVIYYQTDLLDKIYIITASHCLFQDGEAFTNLYGEIYIDVYNSITNLYEEITLKNINKNLFYKDTNKDVAILVLDKLEIESKIGSIPLINVIRERNSFQNFIVKGFPNATQGQELDVIYPTWKQQMTGTNKFQLQLNEDYTQWAIQGFSGSGVFLNIDKEVYLYGIFTRFRPEDRGKVIYCQYIETINELLDQNYLPKIKFTYLGELGLTPNFFYSHIEKSKEHLGTRFNEKLNFKLPIAQLFNDISKDDFHKHKLLKIVDLWLMEKGQSRYIKNKLLDSIEKDLLGIRQKVENWVLNIDFSLDKKIDIDWIIEGLKQLDEKIELKTRELYNLRTEELKKNPKKEKDYSYRYPLQDEISKLREIERNNSKFIYNLTDKINIQLANNPYLILRGEAGSGKSHLLGDIANERIKQNFPVLLLLGQNFKNTSIEQNILSQLDIQCSFKELMISLNNIGKQIGNRVLILIDAINEGAGADLWLNSIAGFIKEVSSYPNIGLVLSIRSTYFETTIPENVRKNENITFKTHEGFKGNEYVALKLFCEHYNLKQPNFPILAPEFTNPLFLLLICEGVKNSPEKTFPQGFQGINNVFEFYIDSLNRKFASKQEYKNRKNLVRESIHRVAFTCYEKEGRSLPLEEALGIFDKEFPKFPNLLNDLIEESVFIKNIITDYKTDTTYEVIYFAYQRFGDFYIANELITKYFSINEIQIAFQKENELGKLFKHNYWSYNGILETLAVLLPEKLGLEIFEVLDWVLIQDKKDSKREKFHFKDNSKTIFYLLLKSLKWRTPQSIDDDKITKWLKTYHSIINYDEWLYALIELTAIPYHPLNSDRLHRILKRYKISERDSFWLPHIRNYREKDDYGNAFPIPRLIDWAWTFNISKQLDYETTRLTAQTLTWILSSTDTIQRDQTTKALVNLLEQQPEALIITLKAFKNIDDLYILERLYAVAYGCILRTEKIESVKKIAQFTYNTIFKKGNPPTHILLRDYARNIIEFALYKKIKLNINERLIRPPYTSKMPDIPSKEEIQKYNLDIDTKENEEYGYLYNNIYHEVIKWDFGRKVIDPAFDNFKQTSFTFVKEYRDFKNRITKKQKDLLKLFEILNSLNFHSHNENYNINQTEKEIVQNEYDDLLNNRLKVNFQAEEYSFIINKVVPHLENTERDKDWRYRHFDTSGVRRWIVGRVFNLGYSMRLHGHYDKYYTKYGGHYYEVDRIGEKYQNIALHEILSMTTDNYLMKGRWSNDTKYRFYKGAWQLYIRDIDPAFTTKNREKEEEFENDLGLLKSECIWWNKPKYNYWNLPDSEWVEKLEDLPNPTMVLEKRDDKGNEWLHLEQYVEWREPKPLGKDKYFISHKQIWYLIQGYLVNKKDKNKIIQYLEDKNFWGRWMPENRGNYSKLINREKFWSPAYNDSEKEFKWETITNTNHKVIVATTEAKGGFEEDKSNANFNYNIPCKTIFEGMHLQYSPIDGDFIDEKRDLVVTNINSEGVLIRKDKLIHFLKKQNLDVIWTILGEKMAVEKGEEFLHDSYYHFGIPCGVFYLEDGRLKGEFKMYKRD